MDIYLFRLVVVVLCSSLRILFVVFLLVYRCLSLVIVSRSNASNASNAFRSLDGWVVLLLVIEKKGCEFQRGYLLGYYYNVEYCVLLLL